MRPAQVDRYTLRARLRAFAASRRDRACGVVPCRSEGPELEAVGRAGAWRTRLRGVVMCGHIWTCPVCSQSLRAKRCDRAVRAVKNAGGRWQMVTLTIRHAHGDSLAVMLRGMAAAWRLARQGGALQAVWSARVSASIRSTEVTHGRHGWHPHIHVALRTSEWSEDERTELLRRWKRAVERRLGVSHVPDDAIGVHWSPALDAATTDDARIARYVVKVALELTDASGAKSGPWDVAVAACDGDPRAQALWREYVVATKGRRMVELDDRAAAYARQVTKEHIDPPEVTVCRVPLDSLDLQALRHYERFVSPGVMARLLGDAAVAQHPATAVNAWISLAQSGLRARARRGTGPPIPYARWPMNPSIE